MNCFCNWNSWIMWPQWNAKNIDKSAQGCPINSLLKNWEIAYFLWYIIKVIHHREKVRFKFPFWKSNKVFFFFLQINDSEQETQGWWLNRWLHQVALMTTHTWAENPRGTWKLFVIFDSEEPQDGVLFEWTLMLHGTQVSPYVHQKNVNLEKHSKLAVVKREHESGANFQF